MDRKRDEPDQPYRFDAAYFVVCAMRMGADDNNVLDADEEEQACQHCPPRRKR
ncbi:MAG: hypothetical protein GTN78_22345 [Gemmatimonadales bacterium]|nr:hypothetical protein [Gemmatimonadales bacterium]